MQLEALKPEEILQPSTEQQQIENCRTCLLRNALDIRAEDYCLGSATEEGCKFDWNAGSCPVSACQNRISNTNKN